MQENGKLFSFLIIFCIVLSAFTLKSDRIAKGIEQEEKYSIDTVINSVQIGKLAGNKNLAFGVKNIAEEVLLDKDLELTNSNNASHRISIEIIFFDLEQAKSNIGFYHKDAAITVIRMRGKLTINGKLVKTVIAEEKSSEIAVSSFVVSEDGGFNQQTTSNAIKKTCISLIEKIITKK
jgi:hypothetical protein